MESCYLICLLNLDWLSPIHYKIFLFSQHILSGKLLCNSISRNFCIYLLLCISIFSTWKHNHLMTSMNMFDLFLPINMVISWGSDIRKQVCAFTTVMKWMYRKKANMKMRPSKDIFSQTWFILGCSQELTSGSCLSYVEGVNCIWSERRPTESPQIP